MLSKEIESRVPFTPSVYWVTQNCKKFHTLVHVENILQNWGKVKPGNLFVNIPGVHNLVQVQRAYYSLQLRVRLLLTL